MVPACSKTRIPDACMAARTAAATSWSSLIKMRGAASKIVTWDPKALKIEATCTPVAPAPITSIDGGAEEKPQASLWVHVKSKPGRSSRRGLPPVQTMNCSARSGGARALSTRCSSMNRAAPACS